MAATVPEPTAKRGSRTVRSARTAGGAGTETREGAADVNEAAEAESEADVAMEMEMEMEEVVGV